jgi:hypothetical protein
VWAQSPTGVDAKPATPEIQETKLSGVGLGSIAGKLTDLYSKSLSGAKLVLRCEATGAEQRTTTGRNGSYQFVGVAAGEYTLEAESEALGHGRLDGIVVTGGHEARLQTAMEFTAATVVLAREKPAVEPVVAGVGDAERKIPARSGVAAAGDAAELPQPLEPAVRAAELKAIMPAILVPGAAKADLVPGLPALREPGEAVALESPEMTATLAQEILVGFPLTGSAVGVVEESEPVRAVAGEIDPVTPVVTTAMTAEQVQGLPVGGRRWQDFVLDSPTAGGVTGGGMQMSLRGAGLMGPGMSVDGANTGLAFGGDRGTGSEVQGSGDGTGGMGQAWAGGRGFAVGETAIREMRTTAGNAEAEGARAAGGGVRVETAGGGNELHGQGFVFDRQNTWGAQNPFTQWVKETAAATDMTTPTFTPESYTPPDHETTWGMGAGGHLRRDKVFWFAALDSFNRNDPALATAKHPLDLCGNVNANGQCTYPAGIFERPSDCQLVTLATRLGFEGGLNQADCVSGVPQGLTAYSSMLETLAGLLGPAPRTAKQWNGFARMDWQAAERHRFTLEGIGADWNSPGGGLTRVSENYGNHSLGSSKASEEWLLGRWEAFLTPNLLVVSQGSVGRTIQSAPAETPSAFEQTFLAPNVWGQLPQIVVDNRYGFTIGNPSRFGKGSFPDERIYQAQESVDWVRGSLLVKAGFELSHNSDATSLLRNETGTYNYSSVENFVSDALVFAKYGLGGESNSDDLHNCDETGKTWINTNGQQMGLGNLPCYSSYSQTLGPTNWNLSTNDWAGYATAQWQPKPLFVVSAGLRWEFEQMPPPIAALTNLQLPLTEKMPSLGNDLGPRISMAVGNAKGHWPVLRLGYGMYFGRTENSTLESALTETGSAKGDLKFFMRPTDDLIGGGAPPFPYVPAGLPGNVVKPGAAQFASNFRNPEVHQAVAAVEESLPGHVELTASAMASLGRRLPVTIDANLAQPTAEQTVTYNVCDETSGGTGNTQCGHTGLGPIKAAQITVPFYASWPGSDGNCPYYQPASAAVPGWLCPDYQGIDELASKANSTYEAVMVRLVRYGRRGLSFQAHYTYSHAMDWNPGESPLFPDSLSQGSGFSQEYGTSSQDMRHSAGAMVTFEPPWRLHKMAGRLGNGWRLSGTGHFHSGLPYTMRTGGALAEEFTNGGAPLVGLAPGMNGSGGDSRIFGVGSDNVVYNIGRNTYRYPSTWKADMRVGKSFDLGETRRLEFMLESFNLFNHQNVTELETTGYTIESGSPPSALGAAGSLPTLNFLTGLKTNPKTGLTTPAFGQPLNVNATDFYRERQVQVGMRLRF